MHWKRWQKNCATGSDGFSGRDLVDVERHSYTDRLCLCKRLRSHIAKWPWPDYPYPDRIDCPPRQLGAPFNTSGGVVGFPLAAIPAAVGRRRFWGGFRTVCYKRGLPAKQTRATDMESVECDRKVQLAMANKQIAVGQLVVAATYLDSAPSDRYED